MAPTLTVDNQTAKGQWPCCQGLTAWPLSLGSLVVHLFNLDATFPNTRCFLYKSGYRWDETGGGTTCWGKKFEKFAHLSNIISFQSLLRHMEQLPLSFRNLVLEDKKWKYKFGLFLFQRWSMVVQSGNASSVLGSMPQLLHSIYYSQCL